MATYTVKFQLKNGSSKFIRVEADNKKDAAYRAASKAEAVATNDGELVSRVVSVGRG